MKPVFGSSFKILILLTSCATSCLLLSYSTGARAFDGERADSFALEKARLQGFSLHENENAAFDRAREKAKTEEKRAVIADRAQAEAARLEYKREKAKERPLEQTVAYKEYLEQALKDYQQSQVREKAQSEVKKSVERKKFNYIVTESKELGLDKDPARADHAKRWSYTGKSPFGAGKISTGGASSGNSGGSSGGYSGGYSEPPPFQDFGADSYSPAPMIEDFSDLPPPPPPPPPLDGTFNGGVGGDGGFVPPPVPPPDFGSQEFF